MTYCSSKIPAILQIRSKNPEMEFSTDTTFNLNINFFMKK